MVHSKKKELNRNIPEEDLIEDILDKDSKTTGLRIFKEQKEDMERAKKWCMRKMKNINKDMEKQKRNWKERAVKHNNWNEKSIRGIQRHIWAGRRKNQQTWRQDYGLLNRSNGKKDWEKKIEEKWMVRLAAQKCEHTHGVLWAAAPESGIYHGSPIQPRNGFHMWLHTRRGHQLQPTLTQLGGASVAGELKRAGGP